MEGEEETVVSSTFQGKIVFDSYRLEEKFQNMDIFVIDASGETNLTGKNPSTDWFPCWSPDGTKIAFISDRDDNDEIYVMDADGENQVNLTNSRNRDMEPSWSPDGKQIAFWSNQGGIPSPF